MHDTLWFSLHLKGNTQYLRDVWFSLHLKGNTQYQRDVWFSLHLKGNTHYQRDVWFSLHLKGNTQYQRDVCFSFYSTFMWQTIFLSGTWRYLPDKHFLRSYRKQLKCNRGQSTDILLLSVLLSWSILPINCTFSLRHSVW